jgi:hypothetical protein
MLKINSIKARPLTRSKVKSAVDFQDITLDRIAKIVSVFLNKSLKRKFGDFI